MPATGKAGYNAVIESEETMKKAAARKTTRRTTDELRDEYQFDYSKAKPNRFASRVDKGRLVVALDPDVSEVFTTPEDVNRALRAFIEAMPTTREPNRSWSGAEA